MAGICKKQLKDKDYKIFIKHIIFLHKMKISRASFNMPNHYLMFH